MTRRIQITLLSLLMSVCAMASNTSVLNAEGVEIWYNFNSSTKTASVTYRGNYSSSYSNEYTGNVVIPSTVTYKGVEYSVTSIGGAVFLGCDALTSITIPEGVTLIGGDAFEGCDALTKVEYNGTVADWCGISFGNYSANPLEYASHFYIDGEEVKDLVIPSGVTAIKDYAFYNCDGLTSITLPEGVTSIGAAAFRDCDALTSITIPEGVTSIGNCAFYGTVFYDTESNWEDGVLYIGDYLIDALGISGGYTVKAGTTLIGECAFYLCKGLTSITLPESLTSIGDDAFMYCSSLTSITSKNTTPPTIGGSYYYTSYDVDKSIPVYVPKSSVDAYKSAVYWKYFTNIVGAYFVDVTAENGTVKGAGAYKENAKVTLTVTPAEGYKFVQWSDGVTDNPRTVVVTSDMTFTADIQKGWTVYATAENGDISGVGVYLENEEATLTATPAEGYKFVQWSDGVTDNPRTVVVVSDMTFTAEFELKEYTLTTEAENGTVEGAGTYKHGDEATLTATPNDGYKFVQWSDCVTDNPRTVVVTSDMTFTAEFELKEYTLTTEAENGTVEGAGTYKHGDEAKLTATPAEGYKFVQWSDGVTDNPRTVEVTSDLTLTAEFELKEYTLTTEAENGTVEGAGTYKHGDEATLTATPAEGYKFVQWSDGVTDNSRTIVVVSDMTFTAEFELKEYTLTTEAENGTVEGAGTYKHGDEATLTATPAEGYKFVQWSDGVTDNPRTVEVTSDLTLTAEFEIDVTPISDIQTSDVKVRLNGNEIAVEGADDYTVYSISGQNLGKAESVERGIYIVVANGKCYKVIAK